MGCGENDIPHTELTTKSKIMQLEDKTRIAAFNRDRSADIGRTRTVALFATHERGLLLRGGAADNHIEKEGGILLCVFLLLLCLKGSIWVNVHSIANVFEEIVTVMSQMVAATVSHAQTVSGARAIEDSESMAWVSNVTQRYAVAPI